MLAMKHLVHAIVFCSLVGAEPAIVKASPTAPASVPQVTLVNISPKPNQAEITDRQLEDLYSAIRSVPKTSREYVDAYIRAISTRSGLYARAYLATSIRHQIPAKQSARQEWIGKWTITPAGKDGQEERFKVSAYSPPVGTRLTWVKVFDAHITIRSNRSDKEFARPFIITSQRFDWSYGWEDPRWSA